MPASVANDPIFIERVIVGDDTWAYEYDVKTAQQSSEKRNKNEPRQSPSKIKVMLLDFFNYRGLIQSEFIAKVKYTSPSRGV